MIPSQRTSSRTGGGLATERRRGPADQHRTHLSACTYSSNVHLTDAAYLTQLLAVSSAPKVKMVDLFGSICATRTCPTVIGNVLVYRQGSHLTATYLTTAGLRAQFKVGSR